MSQAERLTQCFFTLSALILCSRSVNAVAQCQKICQNNRETEFLAKEALTQNKKEKYFLLRGVIFFL